MHERWWITINYLAIIDNKAVAELCRARVTCNQTLRDHPTVQMMDVDTCTTVGLLGILNGFLGKYDEVPGEGYGLVAVEWADDASTIVRFGITRQLFADNSVSKGNDTPQPPVKGTFEYPEAIQPALAVVVDCATKLPFADEKPVTFPSRSGTINTQ